MSSSIALALIAASFVIGVICYLYASKLANDVVDETVIGVIRGVPIPTKFRGARFYRMFGGYGSAAVVSAILPAFVNAKIARQAVDANVRSLAQFALTIGALGVVGWLLNGALDVVYVRSVLRQGKAD